MSRAIGQVYFDLAVYLQPIAEKPPIFSQALIAATSFTHSSGIDVSAGADAGAGVVTAAEKVGGAASSAAAVPDNMKLDAINNNVIFFIVRISLLINIFFNLANGSVALVMIFLQMPC